MIAIHLFLTVIAAAPGSTVNDPTVAPAGLEMPSEPAGIPASEHPILLPPALEKLIAPLKELAEALSRETENPADDAELAPVELTESYLLPEEILPEGGQNPEGALGEPLEEAPEDPPAEPVRASFHEEEEKSSDPSSAPDLATVKVQGTSPTVLEVKSNTKVASEYVRIMEVVRVVDDPENLAPFIGEIILCRAPKLDEYLTVSRDLIRKRIREGGVPLDRVLITGSRTVLVFRTKAHAPEKPERDEEGNEAGGAKAPGKNAEVKILKDSPVLIVRQGKFFRLEERGKALQNGLLGEVIDILDRKGRTFKARITGPGTVSPVEEKTGGRKRSRRISLIRKR